MRPQDVTIANDLSQKLINFDNTVTPLPGLSSSAHLTSLVLQMIDSIKRVKYIRVIRDRPLSSFYANPSTVFFDPIKAASWAAQNRDFEEAFWLSFLSVHFGKNRKSGWALVRETYAGTGSGGNWNWRRICTNFSNFRNWLDINNKRIRQTGSFGNHRKYQSLDAISNSGTGMAIGSYIEWVMSRGNHHSLIQNAVNEVRQDPRSLFQYLYKSMSDVVSFGRTAKFDYLTLIGKLGLARIEPGSAFIENATGPKRGAKLLFGGSINSRINDGRLTELIHLLEQYLALDFGMQILEDSLCNWQKNPEAFIHFSG